MNKSPPDNLIRNASEFDGIQLDSASIIDYSAKLPSFVFKKKFGAYYAIEMAYLYRSTFAEFLESIGREFSDKRINYINIEPDPINYYFDRHGFYGAASFKLSEISKSYLDTMNRGGRADSFFYRGGDIGLFWGSSQEWAIYFDRISWELAIIAGPTRFHKLDNSDFVILDKKKLYEYILSQYNPYEASRFTRMFIRNYQKLNISVTDNFPD